MFHECHVCMLNVHTPLYTVQALMPYQEWKNIYVLIPIFGNLQLLEIPTNNVLSVFMAEIICSIRPSIRSARSHSKVLISDALEMEVIVFLDFWRHPKRWKGLQTFTSVFLKYPSAITNIKGPCSKQGDPHTMYEVQLSFNHH